MRKCTWLLAAGGLLLSAWDGETPPQATTQGVQVGQPLPDVRDVDGHAIAKMARDAAPTDEFVEGLPFFGIRQLPALRAIGTVVREKVRRSPNPHVPGTETEFRTLEFGGLVLDGFVKTGEGGGFATCHAVVSGGTWLLPKGLRVGVEFAGVERALGPPVVTEGDVRRYGGLRTQTQVDFKVEAGRVTEIVVTPWCD